MEIVTKNISELIPAEFNPRIDLQPDDKEYKKLDKSIKKFGYIEPIIWNKKTGRIVGGHQRIKILSAMGIKSVDVSVVELSDDDEKALNIALNKISGKWDVIKLESLVTELKLKKYDLELTGFDDLELKKMSDNVNVELDDVTYNDSDKKRITITFPSEIEDDIMDQIKKINSQYPDMVIYE
jgi:ParB-like chromosome segregation protein Spo0J